MYLSLSQNILNPLEIWSRVSPDSSFTPGTQKKLNRLAHTLSEILKDYLAEKHLKGQAFLREMLFVREILKRQASTDPDVVLSYMLKAKHKITRERPGKLEQIKGEFELNRELMFYWLKHDSSRMLKLSTEYFQSFDHWWIIEKLKFSLVYGSQPQSPDDPVLEQIFRQTDWSSVPLIGQLYKRIFGLMKREHEEWRAVLKECYANQQVFDHKEQLDIYAFLLNYVTTEYNRSREREFLLARYLLLLWGIKSGIAFIDQYLPAETYLNIVTARARLGHHAHALKLAEKWKRNLSSGSARGRVKPGEAYRLAQAYLAFIRKDYREVRAFGSRNAAYSSNYLEIMNRMLIIMASYEVDIADRPTLRSTLKALHAFVKRSQAEEWRKNIYFTWIRFFNPLVRPNVRREELRIEHEQLKKASYLPFWNWLIDTYEEVNSSY